MEEEIFQDEGSARLFQLIHMFQRTALMNLGELPNFQGEKEYNLPEAKESIDLLMMLQDKTKGNLNNIEAQMLKGVISEIQMIFFNAPSNQRTHLDEKAQSEIVKESFIDPTESPSEIIISEEE